MANQYNNYDLDLYELDSTFSPEGVVSMIRPVVMADSDWKIWPAKQWLDNFLYYCGIRDLPGRIGTSTVINNSLMSPFATQGAGSNASRRRIAKVFKAVQVMASNMTRQRASIKVWPESDDELAVRKAKLSNILLDYEWDKSCEDDMYYEAVLWALLTPAVARKDSLDFSFEKSRIWPVFDESIDPYTGQPVAVPRKRADGTEEVEQLPWTSQELVSAFRLIFNPTATWQYDVDFIGDIDVKRLQWVVQNYNKDAEGYLPHNLEKLTRGPNLITPCMAMESALKQMSFGSYRSYRNFNYSNLSQKDGVSVINMYIKPSPNFPEGREIVIANDILLYDGKSRVYRENPTVWHPYSVLTYERVPGRLWGTTYAEKITDINRAYEQARSELDQLRRTFSTPKMALPIGAQIDRDTITGDEQVLRYNPYGPDGGKPAYVNAPQPPSTIVDDIKLTDADFTYMSGVTEIMMGIRPQGVTTYRGLEVLREEANNSQNNFIRQYENLIWRSQQNKLENLRKCLKYPDKALVNAIKIFKKMNQYVTDIDIVNFVGGDLAGYVKIEPYSTLGKSKLAIQEKLMSMAQMGVLGDVAGDPDLNQEFKRKMDVSGFETPMNKQVVYARYENQLMLSSQDKGMPIVPPVYEWHDDAVHLREVEQLLLDPTLQGKDLILQSLLQHREMHQQQMAMKMQQQMMAQMQMAQGQAGQVGKEDKSKNGSGAGVIPGQGEQGVMFGPETGFVSQGGPDLV